MDANELRAYAAFYLDIERRLGSKPEARDAHEMAEKYLHRARDVERRDRATAPIPGRVPVNRRAAH
jgi:hypothetical protein